MAHPDETVAEAVDAPASLSGQAAVDAFANVLGEGEDSAADEGEDDTATLDGDDADLDDPDEGPDEDEAQDDEGPDESATPAPVSFKEDEKKAFAKLPIELQQAVAAIETRRNADVQKATTEAANAQRNARSDATAHLAQIQQTYAEQLAQYANAFEVAQPDYSLLATDPAAFAEQASFYEQAKAHRQNLAEQARIESDNARQARESYNQHQIQLVQEAIPEWRDPAKFNEGVTLLRKAGAELGFAPEELAELTASDVFKLRRVNELLEVEKAYKAMKAKQMERVRSFKGKPAPVSRPGVAQSRDSRTAGKANAAIERLAANPHNRQAAEDAFAALM